MTKSAITREQLEEWVAQFDEDGGCDATDRQLETLIRQSLAAMDSEPVAWQYRVSAGPATGWSLWHDGKGEQYENSYKVERRPLYCHAQPALVQPVMFIDGDISSEDADKLAKVIREFNEEDERPLAKMARIIRDNPHPTNECDMPKAQPAPVVPVVPDDVLDALRKVARIRLDLNDFDGDRRGIVDCLSDAEEALIEVVNSRAAMLAAAPQEVKGE
uniref:Ead/Ea22-like family protein n=1 Tax=Klebsiella pneumoniae TaxID=573 RepID=A0A486V8C7_KLEPN|nr:Uncharacterised protein [Klebsiella pneumoniae]